MGVGVGCGILKIVIELRTQNSDGTEVSALVNPTGAALVALEVGQLELVQRYTSKAPPLGAGITLAPWPNRVRNGRWVASGKPQQLELTEPGQPNAIHGFVRHTLFERVDNLSDQRAVTLETSIGPEPGWSYKVNLVVSYRLVNDGLIVSYTARNDGGTAAPFAIGSHPYFTVRPAHTEDLIVTVPAEVVLINDQGGIPVGRQAVSGDQDLRRGRRVGEVQLGHCYTAFTETDGKNTVTLATQSGDMLKIWAEPAFAYWVLFNPSNFPGPDGPVRAIAIEPMTAPPDALNSGEGLRWLLPGDEWSLSWGVSAHSASPTTGSHRPDSIDR